MHRTARVKSLDRGLEIIEAIAREGRHLRISEIADALQVSQSTASRLTATLRDRGFLDQERHGGRYALGLRLTRYARLAASASPLEVAARPVIAELVSELGDTISLSVPMTSGVMYVWSEVPQTGLLKIVIDVGTIIIGYTGTAPGRAMLSCMAEDERELMLPAAPDEGDAADFEAKLKKEIEDTADRGYAIEIGEGDPDVACVATAILDERGELIGALSCSMPRRAASEEHIEHVAGALRGAVQTISETRASMMDAGA